MTDRNVIIVLAISYLLGISGGWAFHNKIKPSDEQIFQREVNQEISDDLCYRIKTDVDRFQESPQTFKRSSLKVLISESTIATKSLFPDMNQAMQVKFIAAHGESITSVCQKDAIRWINIPSVFPELYEEEYELVVGKPIVAETIKLDKEPREAITKRDNRLAVVIGNSSYENRPLKNPINDAKDISAVLKKSGFKVIEVYDADLPKMKDAIDEFTNNLSQYDVGLVYYSGHGIEFSGRNYFIPINADIKAEEEIPRQGYDATEIVEKLSRNNIKTSIFILDACRNSPVFSTYKTQNSGLAIMQGSTGSVVAFSAAPGQVALDGNGRNSPYTSELLRQIQIPNKKIEDVLKDTAKVVYDKTAGRQIPWYNSGLVGDFYFNQVN